MRIQYPRRTDFYGEDSIVIDRFFLTDGRTVAAGRANEAVRMRLNEALKSFEDLTDFAQLPESGNEYPR